MAMDATLKKVVSISIAVFVAAITVPLALVTLANATWTADNGSVDPVVVTVVTILLPVIAVLAIVLYFLRDEM